jgi:DNA modification methylase
MSVCLNCFNEDCLEGMRKLESDSVDLLVTDPPYGYSFMGKDWDKAVSSVEIWKECLRVLKPGCFAFVMSAPRSDVQCEMILKLKEAGFEVGFTPIYWAYASGFPKACNISKMVDKRLGVKQEIKGFQEWNNPMNKPATSHYDKVNARDENPLPIYGATSPDAKVLDGLFGGFQPKPAVEVVLVVMKPIEEKTFVEQALKNNHGGTWLGKCRIPYANQNDSESYDFNRRGSTERSTLDIGDKLTEDKTYDGGWTKQGQVSDLPDGRFPANLLVSDNILDNGNITKSNSDISRFINKDGVKSNKGFASGNNVIGFSCPDDVGGFSRYFSLDAWWEKAVQELPEEQRKTFPFLIVPKASKSEKNKGCEELEARQVNDGRNILPDNAFQRGKTQRLNIHPTVKPLKLMQYLITLGSNKGEIVLDPFMGSGTTLIAAKITNRKGIGFELSEDYFKIALARIKSLEQQKELV